MPSKPKVPILIRIEDIILMQNGRPVDRKKVKQLQCSIGDQGLLHPIHVYRLGHPHKGKFGLAAGQHRLQACINLGFKTIAAVILKRKAARAWRDSENLHRNGARALEVSRSIVKYAKNRQALPNVKKRLGGEQPHDKGYSVLSEETGFDRKRIAEAYRHHRLSSTVRGAIEKRPRCNTRAFLNKLVRLKSEDEQLRKIQSTSKKRAAGGLDGSADDELSMLPETKKLGRRWQKSSFREQYEDAPIKVRREFVRLFLI